MNSFVRCRSAWLTLALTFGFGCGDGGAHVTRAVAGRASVAPPQGDGGASGDDSAGGKPAAGGDYAGGKHAAGGRAGVGGGAAHSGGSAGRSSTGTAGERGQEHGSAGEA